MDAVRIAGVALVLLAAVPAFGGQPPAPVAVEVFKPDGSLQCTGGGVALDEMAKELTVAGIAVTASRKGSDGLVHIAQCGTPSGAINLYTIAAASLDKARSLGFQAAPRGP